jgi:hypothetical protein
MEHGRFRCLHCQRVRRRRTKDQRYCNGPECQRARRNGWRRDKYGSDSDYRANQRASTRAWLVAQGGSAQWYREYRRRHHLSAAAATTPEAQAQVAAGEPPPAAAVDVPSGTRANSDATGRESPVRSGTYRLIAVDGAKRDAIMVELLVVSDG